MTKAEAVALTQKYAGKEFTFYSPFEGHAGWKDGDRGIIVRLLNYVDDADEVTVDTNDLWVALHSNGEKCSYIYGHEAYILGTKTPLIEEQAATNWSP